MPLHSTHLDRLREALKSEEYFQRAGHTDVQAMDLNTRVELGHSWAGVRIEAAAPMRAREARVIVRGTLHEGIGAGDPVVVNGHRGRCVGWDPTAAELAFERTSSEDVVSASVVDKGFDASNWVALRKALERADEHLEQSKGGLATALLEGVDMAAALSGLQAPSAPIRGDAWSSLNAAQAAAASAAVGADHLAVIHGPPGTGKTRTLVAILAALTGTRWALAESNAAVDNLALGAAAAGLHVVRVGPSFRMSGPVRELSVGHRMSTGPYAQALKAIDRDIARAQDGPDRWKLFDQRRDLQTVARTQVLEQADVIATTFGSLIRRADELPPAHTAVVDEVTQAIEPSIWAAVPHVERLILAGDPHQLGPVVMEPDNILSVGLLDRLQTLDVPMPMLTEQHRMSETIMALVADVYGPDYTAHPSVADQSLNDVPSFGAPALFVDTAGMSEEARDPTSRSVYNEVEVTLIGLAISELVGAGVPADSIGVIAPYSAQVERLSALPQCAGIEVATVNAFQGREADVILMSFTRANEDGALGFVADRRRLTVAVTRARRLLWMCGDTATLTRNPDLAAMLAAVTLQSIWEPPWSAAI